jgi:integral membrane sensor domain MASE1
MVAPWPARWRGWLVDASWAAVFVLLAGVSTLFNPGHAPHAPLWAPTGVALGLALVWGGRALPAYAVGAFIAHGAHAVHASGGVLTADAVSTTALFTLAELVVVGGAASWIRRQHTAPQRFERVRHLFGFLAAAGVVLPALGGAVIVGGGALGVPLPAGTQAEHWMAARAASAVLTGPAIAAFLMGEVPRWTKTAALQVGTVFAFAIVAPLAVWSGWPVPPAVTALLVALAPPRSSGWRWSWAAG